ncbi:DUF4955 domain-containing protein [Algibacter amylolyticus]|uniref:DUF4955 domain-containing protein n=1 Tax=Algibacter amylolyticus TaxID=1608400 RepID=A0A5M7BBD9_9FLAO|nr:right-handed parallel beta-helix repeat-containing protein [Algibacter amylolyticus]KAA5824804.1 DUF4955 domain-containing protein [Algibacter amylolyticus]MBB5268922.1 hypothetical protein [Algibacter amylolyticus]TSJ75969.1 DUF4955 domain-containing protein [Algibacter amylolyticus]
MKKRSIYFYTILFSVIIIGCKAQEESKIYSEYVKNPDTSLLPNFSYAGYNYGEIEIPVNPVRINVTKYGVSVNSKFDQTKNIQKLIDSIGRLGGGVLFFPSGEYSLNAISEERSFLTIDYSNVVLRGDKNTVFMNCQTLIQLEKSPWLSPAILRVGNTLQGTDKFWGIPAGVESKDVFVGATGVGVSGNIYPAKELTKILKNSNKGSKVISVESTGGISPGDFILIAMYNTTDNGNLIHEIMSPWHTFKPYMKNANEAGKNKAASYQWLVEVDRVSKQEIFLKQPCRVDIKTEFKPIVAAAPMLSGIGVENITFASKWKGDYCHHGCKSSNKAESLIMDYGWNAIQFVRTSHSWIKNVTIKNYNCGISLLDTKNVTVEDINISGYNGHYGIKVYSHANDNLIQNVNFEANFTHMLSAEGNSYGNVFRNIHYNLKKNELKANFDFHGFGDKTFAPPADNLFELITGFNNITGGGATFNLPHTAKGNTFWNVTFDGLEKDDDLFRYWVYENKKFGTSNETDDYIYFPGTIVAGAISNHKNIKVNSDIKDRQSDFLYFRDINKSVLPVSLYQAQLNNRLTAQSRNLSN